MKKIFIWLLILSLVAVFSLAGCDKAGEAEEEVIAEEEEEEVVAEEEEVAEEPADVPITIKYAHMNTPESIAGKQADYFANLVMEKNSSITVEVYPSSQLGTLQELAEMLGNGSVEMSHNTMAAMGSQYSSYGVLDTPYLYKDVDHLMRVTDINSPLMQTLNQGAIAAKNIRQLYTFYFGARELTCNEAIYAPEDLADKKIRAIPFPIYMTAVEGMGAIATPIDWSEVPTALATGQADGQENPVNVIFANKLFDVQSHCMLTNHIMAAQYVGINEDVWQSLSDNQQAAISEAAAEASVYATDLTKDSETTDVQNLIDAGMTIITEADGLDVDAFRAGVMTLVEERFNEVWGDLYNIIAKIE